MKKTRKNHLAEISEKIFAKFGIEEGLTLICGLSATQLEGLL